MAGSRAGRERPSPTTAVRMEVSLSRLLARAMEKRWHAVVLERARSSRRCTEESIHDLRVAMRRFMASMDLAMLVLPASDLPRARRAVRKDLKSFNALRDTHVQIITVRALARRFPVLRAYRDELVRAERRHVVAARKKLPHLLLERVEGPTGRAIQALMAQASDPVSDSIARAIAFGVLGSAFARAAERQRQLSPADPGTIHRLRVAFKKCRYSTEILREVIPGATRRMLKAMNTYQTRMGEIQDLRILSGGVSAYALRRRSVRGSFIPLQEFLAERQRERVRAFLDSSDELYSFWTPGRVSRGKG